MSAQDRDFPTDAMHSGAKLLALALAEAHAECLPAEECKARAKALTALLLEAGVLNLLESYRVSYSFDGYPAAPGGECYHHVSVGIESLTIATICCDQH